MARTKKDIGKETMYNKIMPTTKAGKAAQPDEQAQDILMEQAAPATGEQAPEPSAQGSLFRQPGGVSLTEGQPLVLINLMERLVAERLNSALGRFNCCKCDRCKKDVAAIALNKLPPQYVVVEKNMLMELLAKQANLDVTTAIIQAILLVRDNPRH